MKTVISFIVVVLISLQFAVNAEVILEDCSVSKNCWFASVDGKNCSENQVAQGCSGVSVKATSSNVVEFELYSVDAKSNRYLAIGINDKASMGGSVTACIFPSGGPTTLTIGFPSGRSFSAVDQKITKNDQMELLSSRADNGVLFCRFREHINPLPACKETHDPTLCRNFDANRTDPIYLLLANGNTASGSLTMHDFTPRPIEISASELLVVEQSRSEGSDVFVKDTNNGTVISNDIRLVLIKTHGIAMLIGFWVFSAVAILFARYFRRMWPEANICGKPVYFAFHRTLNLVAFLLVALAVACIFAETNAIWLGNDLTVGYHAICGLAAAICLLFQPILAWMRCEPEDPKRVVFALFHRLIGISAFVLSAATAYLATLLPQSGLSTLSSHGSFIPSGLMIAFFCVVGVTVFIFEVELTCSERLGNKVAPESYPMNTVPPPSGSRRLHYGATGVSDSGNNAVAGATLSKLTQCIRLLVLTAFALSAVGLVAALAFYISTFAQV